MFLRESDDLLMVSACFLSRSVISPASYLPILNCILLHTINVVLSSLLTRSSFPLSPVHGFPDNVHNRKLPVKENLLSFGAIRLPCVTPLFLRITHHWESLSTVHNHPPLHLNTVYLVPLLSTHSPDFFFVLLYSNLCIAFVQRNSAFSIFSVWQIISVSFSCICR